MGFSARQVQTLRRRPNGRHTRTREAHGRELSYLEGWYAISEANRIFGFDGWNRETIESRCVLARENRGTFLAVYIARVRVTVHADGATIIREPPQTAPPDHPLDEWWRHKEGWRSAVHFVLVQRNR
jgi:Rad52/22 family double-strand break repair protein